MPWRAACSAHCSSLSCSLIIIHLIWNAEMAAMGRIRSALQFGDLMLIESKKGVKTDPKPPCVELQYNLGLWQKPQSLMNCHGLQLYNPEEKSHQKIFDKPQNHCLSTTYITLLSTKPGLQQCLNHAGLNSKNGGATE